VQDSMPVRIDRYRQNAEQIITSLHAEHPAAPGGGWPFVGAGRYKFPRPSLPIRSAERRRWAAGLVESPVAGLVVHGPGGIGKSRLAAAIATRVGQLEPERLAVVITGEVSADGFLAELATALRGHPEAAARASGQADATAALAAADWPDLPWQDRLAQLREHVLDQVPVLLVLDDFDDNLAAQAGTWSVRDPELAGLLASWADPPAPGKLLITSRNQFTLPDVDGPTLAYRYLGPLPRSAAAELARSMPACGRLDETELDRAWRLTGGHPVALEYLDRVLSADDVRFADVAIRVDAAIQARTGQPVMPTGPEPPAELSPAVAEMIAAAAGDALLGVMWGRLSGGAQALLIGASVHRTRVPASAPLLPPRPGDARDGHDACDGHDGQEGRAAEVPGLIAECAAAGLLTVGPDGVFVHRWTAFELHRRLAESGRARELAAAHRRAAGYWWQRIDAQPQDRRGLTEAKYHTAQATSLPRQGQPAGRAAAGAGRRRARVTLTAAAVLAVVTAGGIAAEHLAAFAGASHPSGAAGLTNTSADSSAAIRSQAAAWVAGQVSAHTTVACDPVMCAELAARGFPALGLTVLRPGPGGLSRNDLNGSTLVVVTPGVRAAFGTRLASAYAPGVIAAFGSGRQQVEVREVAAGGAAAYQAGLASDQAARQAASEQLLRNASFSAAPAARAQLAAGQVDGRLLIVLATMAATEPIQIRSFGDAGPGASSGQPLRSAVIAVPTQRTSTASRTSTADRVDHTSTTITTSTATTSSSGLGYLLSFARAQRPPYQPAEAQIVRTAHGLDVLSIEFTAPSPLGLLPAAGR
jgi:AAA ATPase domain